MNDPTPPAQGAASPVATCGKCGAAMRYNVPRLGPDGGYVHAETGRLTCPGEAYEFRFFRMVENSAEDELEAKWKNHPAHMCRDGHAEIWHNDSEHESCPMCRLITQHDRVRSALEEMIYLWKQHCAPRNIEYDSQIKEARAALDADDGAGNRETDVKAG